MQKDIEDMINKVDIGQLKSYSWLGKGYVSHAYQIDTTQGEFVLLIKKGGSKDNEDFKRHYATLLCLDDAKYMHAPKPVYLSDDGDRIIMTKVKGITSGDLTSFSENDQKKAGYNTINALQELQEIRHRAYIDTFNSIGVIIPEVSDEQSDYQTYVIDSFYPYKQNAPTDSHSDWIERTIKSFKPDLEKGNLDYFWHGDPSRQNIIVANDLYINFIDWSMARFTLVSKNRQDFSLAYLINHVPIFDKFQKVFIKYTAERNEVNTNQPTDFIKEKTQLIKIADICWAYKMYVSSSGEENLEDSKTFKKELDKRIKEYKDNFQNKAS